MTKFTIKDIRDWGPCYDPNRYLPENWSGTILDILDNKEIPFEDRLWVICRDDLVSEKLMRVFAVWCARQVQHLMTDERSIAALDVMDAYCEFYFLIDDPDYRAAWEEERAAARASAWAAMDAAWGAACGAAMDAAEGAAWGAAWDAARAAAWDAAEGAAWGAAWDAARDAERNAQETRLREMILAGVKTGDVL